MWKRNAKNILSLYHVINLIFQLIICGIYKEFMNIWIQTSVYALSWSRGLVCFQESILMYMYVRFHFAWTMKCITKHSPVFQSVWVAIHFQLIINASPCNYSNPIFEVPWNFVLGEHGFLYKDQSRIAAFATISLVRKDNTAKLTVSHSSAESTILLFSSIMGS